jgi:FkbM family methyltransferase
MNLQPGDAMVRQPLRVLLQFRHGLGDAVQLTSVLRHLSQYRPEWTVDVASLVGKHSCFEGLCRRSLRINQDRISPGDYDRVFLLDWHECNTSYADSPSTKVERCLREVFQITPDPSLCRYSMTSSPEAVAAAKAYLQSICGDPPETQQGRFPAAVIHYEGNTSARRKNLSRDAIRELCDGLLRDGITPIILDWDRRSPLPNDRTIHCPDVNHPLWGRSGTGDAQTIAALIHQSSLMVGIDSGPQKVAGATDTPTLAVWTEHHPVHYFGLSPNVLHLVPHDHARHIRGQRDVGLRYFQSNYHHETYTNIIPSLKDAASRLLTGRANSEALIQRSGFWVRPDNVAQDLVVVRDVFEEDVYRLAEVPLPEEIVVDVGAHIGTFATRWRRRNPHSRIVCIEANALNLEALRANVGSYAEVLHAACTYETDAVLLSSVFPNCSSTGGSRVLPQREADAVTDTQYQHPAGQLPRATLEEIMSKFDLPRIDVLKLDCEGSEYSILRNATCLDRVGLIVGEYHGREEFDRLVKERFADWKLRIVKDGHFGIFWLSPDR